MIRACYPKLSAKVLAILPIFWQFSFAEEAQKVIDNLVYPSTIMDSGAEIQDHSYFNFIEQATTLVRPTWA